MDENRKQIIIKEITHWKKSHLLPEHYCDFLLALYTEGNGLQEKNNVFERKYLLFFLLFIPVIMFLLYFTELSLILQMVFSFILIFIGIYLVFFFLKKSLLFQIPLIVSSLILLFVSSKITLNLFPGNFMSLYIVLGLNCLLWLVSGWKFKQLYFMISGIIGLLLLGLSLFT
jgi:hypothetical protein